MEKTIESIPLRNREFVFADRAEAGRQLGILLKEEAAGDGILLAIPAGGVPVALAMRSHLAWPVELLLVRKVQIPWNSEAGFGAVNMDGDRLFNDTLLHSLHLSDEVIESQVKKAQRSINQRNTLFRKDKPLFDLTGKKAVIVDDGLASGYTMLAALQYAARRKPAELIVAVPTGLADTVRRIASEVDRVYCVNIRQSYPFAVANAYRKWHDVSDEEIIQALAAIDEKTAS